MMGAAIPITEETEMASGTRPAADESRHRPADFLRPVLLLLLAEEPTYGYELMDRLRFFGIENDAGGMYRALHSLESDGLVRVRTRHSPAGPDRRVYATTSAGLRSLASSAERLNATRVDLARFLRRQSLLAVSPRSRRAPVGRSPISEALLRLAVS